jgi:hypothetical protein
LTSRTKLGFANGVPSDAIAFLNAFKVTLVDLK